MPSALTLDTIPKKKGSDVLASIVITRKRMNEFLELFYKIQRDPASTVDWPNTSANWKESTLWVTCHKYDESYVTSEGVSKFKGKFYGMEFVLSDERLQSTLALCADYQGEEEEGHLGILILETILSMPQYYNSNYSEALIADKFVQLACFGEVRY